MNYNFELDQTTSEAGNKIEAFRQEQEEHAASEEQIVSSMQGGSSHPIHQSELPPTHWYSQSAPNPFTMNQQRSSLFNDIGTYPPSYTPPAQGPLMVYQPPPPIPYPPPPHGYPPHGYHPYPPHAPHHVPHHILYPAPHHAQPPHHQHHPHDSLPPTHLPSSTSNPHEHHTLSQSQQEQKKSNHVPIDLDQSSCPSSLLLQYPYQNHYPYYPPPPHYHNMPGYPPPPNNNPTVPTDSGEERSPAKLDFSEGQPNSKRSSAGRKTGDQTEEKFRIERNRLARQKEKDLKSWMSNIENKKKETRTEDEMKSYQLFEERRAKKNKRSRERTQEKNREMSAILAIPESRRTEKQKKWLVVYLKSKKRKNEGDRRRRDRLKIIGQSSSKSSIASTQSQEFSDSDYAVEPFPSNSYSVSLGSTKECVSHTSNSRPRRKSEGDQFSIGGQHGQPTLHQQELKPAVHRMRQGEQSDTTVEYCDRISRVETDTASRSATPTNMLDQLVHFMSQSRDFETPGSLLASMSPVRNIEHTTRAGGGLAPLLDSSSLNSTSTSTNVASRQHRHQHPHQQQPHHHQQRQYDYDDTRFNK